MSRKIILPAVFLLLLLLGGCNDEIIEAEMPWNDPAVRLMQHSKTENETYNRPALELQFGNQGDVDAYNVSYTLELKKNNMIVYACGGIIAGGRLEPGEYAIEEVLLSKLENHDEYERVELMVYYSDIVENYYKESYGF